ncbi:deoxyribodipyrimidine photo-lyase [Streptomyces sp. 7N604]|uniref:deoxyribodipyrimidine photo-lyase n=1 Tax=Streptomyces sp. 7N604 TaxID=3457415 RepID=UPI003FD58F27
MVPLFVVDTGIRRTGFAVPNRAAFLADSLADLDAALRARGGRLVVRVGDVVRSGTGSRRAGGRAGACGVGGAYRGRRPIHVGALRAGGMARRRRRRPDITADAHSLSRPSGRTAPRRTPRCRTALK